MAWLSNPPGLFRKSKTKPSTPSIPPASSKTFAMPSSTPGKVCSLKVPMRCTTISFTNVVRTAGTLISARTIVTSNGSAMPSRTTVITIFESIGPRIKSTASFSVRPSKPTPSTWVTKSPGCMPASNAGVPSMGVTTLMNPSSWVTSMPRPPNAPRVSTRMSAAASADKKLEWGSSDVSMPLMAASTNSFESTSSTYPLRIRSKTSPNSSNWR